MFTNFQLGPATRHDPDAAAATAAAARSHPLVPGGHRVALPTAIRRFAARRETDRLTGPTATDPSPSQRRGRTKCYSKSKIKKKS